ncbi:MAG TPA: succinate dehydrogenase, cytochrome b subunit [Hyphomicrobiaceae bacterium]|nr:succinate dehydrogenase, cytochrome b subunit [Hyphomicrobiaceae bacterium]
MRRPSNSAYRRDTLWLTAMVHRVSGVLLACFLPLHFLALGLAINGAARLDGFLKWTDNRWVKAAEVGLVLLLAVHLLGGLRILVIENMPWRDGQKRMALGAVAIATVVAGAFLIGALT